MRDGFRSEALRAALLAALRGSRQDLEDMLMRFGGLPGQTPNFKLAMAFGVEVAAVAGRDAERLLASLGDEAAPAESPRAFLPVAAAHGWAERLSDARASEPAWRALADLATDARRPVRMAVSNALREQCLRAGLADALAERAVLWGQDEEREVAFAATAAALEVLSDARVIAVVRDQETVLAAAASAIEMLEAASRAESRLDGRRRLLTSLTKVSVAILSQLRAAGPAFLALQCERATHPEVRAALSQALVDATSVARSTIDQLRKTLEASAKPLRDPTRVRPGTGRGRRSRNVR